jgi:hypothetical protein
VGNSRNGKGKGKSRIPYILGTFRILAGAASSAPTRKTCGVGVNLVFTLAAARHQIIVLCIGLRLCGCPGETGIVEESKSSRGDRMLERKPMLKLTFEAPRNGWLPTRLLVGEKSLDFSASRVPNNPVQELIDALDKLKNDQAASVWWNLEPDGYFFAFSMMHGNIHFIVSYSHDGKKQNAISQADLLGTKEDILTPLWRGLRNLESLNIQESHWREVNYASLKKPKASATRATKEIAMTHHLKTKLEQSFQLMHDLVAHLEEESLSLDLPNLPSN